MINGLASIALGAYLAAVFYQGNTGALWQLLRGDLFDDPDRAGFLKWGVALLALYAVSLDKRAKPFAAPLIWIALFGLAINTAARNPDFLAKVKDVFKSSWTL